MNGPKCIISSWGFHIWAIWNVTNNFWIRSSHTCTSICNHWSEVKACWCVSFFQQQQQQHHSCVWYPVGGIHCSALKFMDQLHWLLSTAACYDIVTPVPLTSLQHSVSSCSGCKHLLLLFQGYFKWDLLPILFLFPPSQGIHRGIWSTCVFLSPVIQDDFELI